MLLMLAQASVWAQPNSTQGDQSPVVITEGGDSIIIYGISKKRFNELMDELKVKRQIADRLLKTLEEKDVALADRDAKFQELLQQYKEIEQRLAERTDDTAKRARALLDAGQLDEAEKLLKASLATRLKRLDQERVLAAADAFELGKLRQLAIDYVGVREYLEQAVTLAPKNAAYLNNLGVAW